MLSNAPGFDHPLRFGGFTMQSNFPVPVLIAGRFLNATMRRNHDKLDIGITVDGSKIENPDFMAECFMSEFLELKSGFMPG